MANKEILKVIINYLNDNGSASDKDLLLYLYNQLNNRISFEKDENTEYWNETVSNILSILLSYKLISREKNDNFEFKITDGGRSLSQQLR